MDKSYMLPLVTNICRICLMETKDHALNLFAEHEESREMLNRIYSCFHINITNEKSFPNLICRNCINVLNEANDFRMNCFTFEEKFEIYCKQIKIKTECDTVNANNEGINSENVDFDYTDDDFDIPKLQIPNKTWNLKKENDKLECTMLKHTPVAGAHSGFKCSICGKVLKSKLSLTKHYVCMHQKRKHVGTVSGCGVTRRYHCTVCSYSTPHSQTLVNHMHRHNGVRPYQCECGKRFTQSSSLAAHRKIHSNTTFYTCTICGKQFKHAFSLKKHLLVHDSGNYNCEICLKNLKTKQSFQDHMFRHYNIRNYNCEDCGGTFVTSSELQNHRLKHSMLKKVECHLCGYKTNTKKTLIVHLKRHAGDKSYKCGVCASSFYTRGELRRHSGVHSREKPYPCPACAQRLSHSSSLNKHMLNVHGIRYKWSDINGHDGRKIKEPILQNEKKSLRNQQSGQPTTPIEMDSSTVESSVSALNA